MALTTQYNTHIDRIWTMSSKPDGQRRALVPTTASAPARRIDTSTPLDQHPAAVYIASLSANSRRTMIHALNTIARILGADPLLVDEPDQRSRIDPATGEHAKTKQQDYTYLAVDWGALRYPHTNAIRAKLAEDYTPAGANKMLSALRQVLKRAWRLGHMTADEYSKAIDFDNVTGETLPAGRDVTEGERRALLQACANDPTAAGVRDAAIIALMYQTGVRRASVPALDLADYNAQTGELTIRTAKRKKPYVAHIPDNGTKTYLHDWLAVRGAELGPLFYPVSQKGTIERVSPKTGEPWRLTTQAIYNMLVKRAKQAGIEHFSPHDLRRTLAGDLLDAGADIVTVQKILNHANVTTTARYDRRPEETKRKAAALVHVPYIERRQKSLEG